MLLYYLVPCYCEYYLLWDQFYEVTSQFIGFRFIDFYYNALSYQSLNAASCLLSFSHTYSHYDTKDRFNVQHRQLGPSYFRNWEGLGL